jgi:Rrf2 family nitric oxide-sensitive transcriptional repressor
VCAISPVCRRKGIVGRAVKAFLPVFDHCLLADIAGNREVLAELLGLTGKTAEPA